MGKTGIDILRANPERVFAIVEAQPGQGGLYRSDDDGASWSTQRNQPTAQFYRVITDNQFPYRVYGGQQDNSSVSIASAAPGGIGWKDWYPVSGCESAYLAFDPDDPDICPWHLYRGRHRRLGSQDAGGQTDPRLSGAQPRRRRDRPTLPVRLEQPGGGFTA